MAGYLRTILRVLAGILLSLAGLGGLVLPAVPGIFLLLIGIALLFGRSKHIIELKRYLWR